MLASIKRSLKRHFASKVTPALTQVLPNIVLNPTIVPQYERMSDWLPYTAYMDEHDLFLLEVKDKKGRDQPDSLGFTMELSCAIGADSELESAFTALIQEAPANSCMQIQVFGSPDIEPFLYWYQQLRVGELYQDMAAHRAAYYRKATFDPPFESESSVLRRVRLILSCTAVIDDLESSYVISTIAAWRDQLVASLKAVGMFQRLFTPQDIMAWNWDLLNAQQMFTKEREIPNYDDSRLLRSQMRHPQTVTRLTEDGDGLLFTQAGYKPVLLQTLSVSGYPKEYGFGAVTKLLGDFATPTRKYPCPFLITLGLRKPDFEQKKNRVNIAAAEATRRAGTPLAIIDPGLHDKKRDWDIMRDAYSSGHGGVEMYHQILLFSDPERAQDCESSLRSVWRANGFTLAKDTYMGMQALFSSLPMSLTSTLVSDLKIADRMSTKTTFNVIATAPIVIDWNGFGEYVIPLVGLRGTVGAIDLFSNDEGNYNFCVVGTSGSGKSVFCNELVVSYRSIDARAWVIDVGGSYKKTCGLLGGQYIQFHPENDICLNPFPMIRDIDEDMEIVHPLIGQMADGVVGNGISALQYSAIGKAIRLCWDKFGKETTVSKIRDLLALGKFAEDDNFDKEIADIAILLDKYCEGGAYGKYFEGQPNIDFTSDFVVLELEELKGKKDLQSVVLLIMMYRITEEMYLGRRDRKKVVLIDEAWDLLNGGAAAAAFIEAGYRRARKYGGSFGTATQGMDDYFKNPAAEAAFNNADHQFILRTKEASIATMERNERIAMNPAKKQMISRLRKVDKEYAEVFVQSPKGYSVFRIMLDPFSLLLYSSKGEDYEAVERYVSQGMTVREAITQVLQEREHKALVNQ